MNKNVIGWSIVLLIILGLFYAFIVNTSKKVELPPVVETSPTVVDKQQKYIDMLTNKCYNEEEIEVSCKG